ncbi:MAG: hypothetical protein OES20_09100 [Gammaproteobacteria bacterium]|nr:hypothetical protein [Gammaproteobacteria bacterium]MDH3858628.1 hypothetical protein [Gammaproteobacteria bacterium]
MSREASRSEQVIAGYKKHKFAVSALRRFRDLIQDLEEEPASNLRLAAIGLPIILLLIGIAS